eukprot:GDKI01042110.1.p2 GENE.GDKI01042110.1~~GDKI01042110.1.p2  ORF type:complete len:200 (-),score=49.45 GDKI01042110.1:13-612(-)
MARSAEKQMAMLNRWIAMKDSAMKGDRGRRPRMATEVNDLGDAEYWRRSVVREMSRKIQEIQNASLGEARIRDLNDAINKLIVIKGHWEQRVKELGGPDYRAQASGAVDAAGSELTGKEGYKYFGAAKDLPGVRELFEKEVAPSAPRKNRKELSRFLKPDYYGWRDEEDGMLLLAEQARETELQAQAVAEWQAKQGMKA